jgi:8-amino-7-oxononanoate synthase
MSDGRRQRAASLIEGLRTRQSSAPAPLPGTRRPGAPAPFDFSSLPEFRELESLKMLGTMLGVEQGFYRPFDAEAGPVALRGGVPLLNFSTYDYLGLNTHPAVLDAAQSALRTHGVSCSASRLVGGERPLHRAFERDLATFLGVEDAVAMVSGHATNVTTIGTLVGPGDLVIHDELIHNSALEGARLSGAARLSMPHNDLDWLDETLSQRRAQHARVLIVVEGLYSMDGDCPDLHRLVEIKSAYDAWLMVDEAHALGVLGKTGRGIAEAQGVEPGCVEVWMGTLSKTLCSTGGYIAGSAPLVSLLKARAPGFVFSVGLPPVLTASAHAALKLLQAEPERVERLRGNGERLHAALRAAGLDTGPSEGHAVAPVLLGDTPTTALAATRLEARGVSAPAILHPAVPERRARLRLFASAAHEPAQIDRAAAAVAAAVGEARAATARLTSSVRLS